MSMCPAARPIVDQRFRFSVRVTDADGREGVAERAFVARCSTACDLCAP